MQLCRRQSREFLPKKKFLDPLKVCKDFVGGTHHTCAISLLRSPDWRALELAMPQQKVLADQEYGTRICIVMLLLSSFRADQAHNCKYSHRASPSEPCAVFCLLHFKVRKCVDERKN